MLWWAWVGYAWLTSVIDPEEGVVRLVMFVSMAALLVASLAVPDAFGDLGLTFAIAYAFLRGCWLVLFFIASADTPTLRHSIWIGLVPSTAVGVGLLVAASFLDGSAQLALWCAALAIDMLGPFLFGSEGWKLEPHHFAERHGLIFIIALGESIVAIGVGSEAGVDAGVITAAVLGVALAATMWWAYFDVVAIVAARRPRPSCRSGREQNEMARDSYSFLHFPMVAGVVLIALGMKKTIAHVDDPLSPGDRVRAGRRPGDLPARPHRVPAGATSTRSTSSAWCSRSRWSPSSRSPTSPTPWSTLAIVAARDGRADRLRGHPLRRGQRPDPPPGPGIPTQLEPKSASND